MQKSELEHLIRAAAAITNEYEFVIVGSQSILGAVDFPPPECLLSQEADIYPLNAEHLSDLIDGSIGEGSLFHEQFHYYAQGVDSTTATLPDGWKDRLIRLQSINTDGRVGYCLDPVDLFLSKCVANREKDKDYNLALLNAGIVNAQEAIKRADDLPIEEPRKQSVKNLIQRLIKSQHQESSLASVWNASSATCAHSGAIVAISDSEVIQHIGQGRHVVWPAKKLSGDPIEIGNQVDITSDGLVQKLRSSPEISF